MLTFISGWRSADREKVIVDRRDPNRAAVYFIDNASTLPHLLPDTPIVDVWRNGRGELTPSGDETTLVRVNYDTDNDLIVRAVSQTLMRGEDAQIIVVYDAVTALYRLFPALRAASALLAADSRLDASEGDHVIFTRGGSFVWKDHLLESRTAILSGDETLDVGIVDAELAPLDY